MIQLTWKKYREVNARLHKSDAASVCTATTVGWARMAARARSMPPCSTHAASWALSMTKLAKAMLARLTTRALWTDILQQRGIRACRVSVTGINMFME